ncbi:hypothetical protein Hdeb2414_s0010g00347601 [Helianthus debilis subsp. tardiflorus]
MSTIGFEDINLKLKTVDGFCYHFFSQVNSCVTVPEIPTAHHPIRIIERNTSELRTDISDSSRASGASRMIGNHNNWKPSIKKPCRLGPSLLLKLCN